MQKLNQHCIADIGSDGRHYSKLFADIAQPSEAMDIPV